MKYIFTLLVILVGINSFSQDIPKFQKTNYRDSVNNLYWNKDLPVYLSLSPNPDGSNGEILESKISEKYASPFYFDTEGINYMRTRWAVEKETREYAYPKQEVMWEVYADGQPPKTTHSFEQAKSVSIDGKVIFGPNLIVSLKSSDLTSKTKDIYYSINGEAYRIYGGNILFDTEGEQKLKFFAVDNVGNAEDPKEINFSIDFTAPTSSCTITGVSLGNENIVSLTTKIYIEAKDNVSGVKQTYYQIDSLPEVLYYQGTSIPLNILSDGYHLLKFYSIDKVGNKEDVQPFSFYLDKTAPITVSDILGDRFVVGDKIYFSGRTKFKITSIDNKAGVKKVLYSVDGSDIDEYVDPFYMPNEPGWHIVKYFAVDNTDNTTTDEYSKKLLEYKMKVDKVYVDLSGPTISHFISGDKYARNDTVFIGPKSKINLSATDTESGLQFISYSIDGELKETPYSSPFTLESLKTGDHKIEYFGYDNVNNRNIKTFSVIIDNSGPVIGHKFSVVPSSVKNNIEIYPSGVFLFATVQDDLTGVTNIYYSVNGGQKLIYKNYIKGFSKGENTVIIEAYDMLNNMSSYEIKFIVN